VELIGTAEAVPLPILQDQECCEFAMSARIFSNMSKPCPFPIFATAFAANTIPQGLKPCRCVELIGTAEAVPLPILHDQECCEFAMSSVASLQCRVLRVCNVGANVQQHVKAVPYPVLVSA
jgi:hypothetical protein